MGISKNTSYNQLAKKNSRPKLAEKSIFDLDEDTP